MIYNEDSWETSPSASQDRPRDIQALPTKENGHDIIYVRVLKAIYGMLQSALLFYKKLCMDLEDSGIQVNDYDPCVANKMVRGTQMTVVWHVDDMKISHRLKEAVTSFLNWIEDRYGQIGKVKVTRGTVHKYLGMTLDYSKPGKVIVDMKDYVKKDMLNEFPSHELNEKATSPANENLFKINESSPKLSETQKESFHTMVAKGLFLGKRARQEIQTTISFLCTRVQSPTQQDWAKLRRMMRFLNGTQDEVLTLECDDQEGIKWYVDAAFAVHHDFRSHTGATMTLGKGSIMAFSTKQKLNTRSSTEAELVAVDDAMSHIIWSRNFLQEQDYSNTETIVMQDNKSTMLLEENGRQSVGKRSRHLNVRYFFVTDMIQKGVIKVDYCPTGDMIADFFTKPTQGSLFKKFKRIVQNQQE